MPRKEKTESQKSKVYGDKVMKEISRAAVSWAIRESNPEGSNGRRLGTYSGYVKNDIEGRRRVEKLNILSINKELTLDEQRQVLNDVYTRIHRNANARAVDERAKYSRFTGRKGRNRSLTNEEALVLDTLDEQGKTMRQVKKRQVPFGSLPYPVQYILAKHALLYEIGLRDEKLKDRDARIEEQKRLANAREARKRKEEKQREIEREEQKREDENFLVYSEITGKSRIEWENER